MKKISLFLAIAVIGLILFVGKASAVPSSKPPSPVEFGNDIYGTGIFSHTEETLDYEFIDLSPAGLFGSYFVEPVEPRTDAVGDFSIIDFDFNDVNGIILDLEGNPRARNIGSFSVPGGGDAPLFSTPSFNPGRKNNFAAYAYPKNGPGNPPNFVPEQMPPVVTGITPIPEPTTISLLGIGLVGFVGLVARRKYKIAKTNKRV